MKLKALRQRHEVQHNIIPLHHQTPFDLGVFSNQRAEQNLSSETRYGDYESLRRMASQNTKEPTQKSGSWYEGAKYQPYGNIPEPLMMRTGIMEEMRKTRWQQVSRFNEPLQYPRAFFRKPRTERPLISLDKPSVPHKTRIQANPAQELQPKAVRALVVRFQDDLMQKGRLVIAEPAFARNTRKMSKTFKETVLVGKAVEKQIRDMPGM